MIDQQYLLVTNIPCFVDHAGNRYLDSLWHKDLMLHLEYISHLIVACPKRKLEHATTGPMVRVDEDSRLQFRDLPLAKNRIAALICLPQTLIRLKNAVAESELIHCGIAGWPYPLGWPTTFFAKSQKKFLLIIVESAPWRARMGNRKKLRQRGESALYERLGRWCVQQADLAIFTQPEYRSSLLGDDKDSGHVIPASWIDEDVILTEHEYAFAWQQKSPIFCRTVRLLFAGRLVEDKGVRVVVEAARILSDLDSEQPYVFDIMGHGPMKVELTKFAQVHSRNVTVRVLDPLPYGVEFFRHLQTYHGTMIPSLSDEQPRIIFDSYSQGVPVIGSNTPGIASCVKDGETGMLFEAGDASDLAVQCQRFASLNGSIEHMGINCLREARLLTHQKMHQIRCRLLEEALMIQRKRGLGVMG